MKRTSLLSRIQLLVAGVLVGLGVVVAIALWYLTQQALHDRLSGDVSSAVHQLEDAMRKQRTLLLLQSRIVSDRQDLRLALIDQEAGKDRSTIQDLLETLRERLGADGISYRDRFGSFEAATGIRPESLAVPDEAEFDRMLEAPPFGKVDLLPHSKGFLLASLVPLKVGQRILGTISVYGLVGSKAASDLAKVLGVEVVFLQGEEVVAGSAIDLPKSIRLDVDETDFSGNSDSYMGEVVAMKGFSGPTRARVAVFRSTAEASAQFRDLLWLFLAILAAAVGAAMVLAGRLAKGITLPLDQVVAAAVDMEEGRWPEPLPVTRNDEIGLLTGVFNEMADSLRESQRRLLAMVDTDPLTELENHRSFKESLFQEVARRTESNDDLSLILFDIDEFKAYNDRHGMAAGDAALCQIARLLKEQVPEFASCARFGGEEFAILLPLHDLERAAEVAESVRAAVMEGAWPGEAGLTLSAGCAQLGTNTAEAEGLVIASELALWRAKQLGRNRVCRFDSLPGADASADPYQLHKFYQDASLSTIQALAAAVDAKDAYTQGHSQRVAEYASSLARRVGCSDQEVKLIYRTGTLHDVGKIGVPDSILKKPGRLDDEERTIMETHPVLGEEIVKKVPQLQDTLPGVRNHHERWDGKGYPDGLAGEAIPYMARILALADTYDAMTSDRPYRAGMDVDVALRIMEEESGTQFDPDLAPQFVAMIRESYVRKAA